MGQKHNRKRTRHRSMSSRRRHSLLPSCGALSPSGGICGLPSSLPFSNIARTDSAQSSSDGVSDRQSSERCPQPDNEAELAYNREQRIFGGVYGEPDASSLCGPMLDVVLGLFNGVDYEDPIVSGG
ncbi:hypothetical protein BAUCODRAFT_281232 [Baudoinia panamericana UAMH 10762]|uniref:Uncharacterized protein n=1 Tax=Baudoinia panamericana (strain UAMH 10762) TaxID=717646 RepID=M2M7A1_BAUPA|nr:uncharacterized protein BAUCODRAFT_281232 [Baudoinia panamericana UAMH 10762]EMC92191.1 hypothetical protein BAUCODRAFT_281232 [Baudoinia panamericana UAMH 10762]